MYDITSIGEILIDFHCNYDENINMIGSLGGATCNVAIQASKLGNNCCFIGTVGKDVLGIYATKRLNELGVSSYIQKVDSATTMALVSLDENNDRTFDFLRNPGADSQIIYDETIAEIIGNAKILEYGSLSFSKEPASSTIFKILNNAKCIKAYDPNLRPSIWNDDKLMLIKAVEGLQYADLLKIGDDELLKIAKFIGITYNEECEHKDIIFSLAKTIKSKYNIKFVFVTMGPKGCCYFSDNYEGHVDAYNINVIDTTGAGDSFFGAILSQYLKNNLIDLNYSVKYACAAGGITASKKGTAEAMPNDKEILNLIK